MAGGNGRAVVSGRRIAARCLLATIGAYAAGWIYTTALSLALIRLGLERSNAVAWATLTAYAVIIVTVLLAFCVRSVIRLVAAWAAWIVMLILVAATIGSG